MQFKPLKVKKILKSLTISIAVFAVAMFGSERAWAVDVNLASPAVSSGLAVPGCPTATWGVIRSDLGTWSRTSVNMSWSSGHAQAAQVDQNNADTSLIGARGYNYATPVFFGTILQLVCPNLTPVAAEITTGEITDATAFANATFIGAVFTAIDSNDGETYRYTAGFEGASGSVGVFRRELVVSVEDTQGALSDFMLKRANNLASNQPKLARFLMSDSCGAFNANVTDGQGLAEGCVSKGNLWAEVTSQWSGDSFYTLGTLGVHSQINPDLIIGGMLQMDYAEYDTNDASGRGWMAGPYFVARIPDQPLIFEGRILYGQTDNDISLTANNTDSFQTERWLAQLRSTGEYKYHDLTWMPLLDLTYTNDTHETYTDSQGNTISSQTVGLTQVTLGLDFSAPLPVQTGILNLTGGLSGIYALTDNANASFEGGRGRAHLGMDYDTGDGRNLRIGFFYDGIGADYEGYGANFSFVMHF